MVLPPVFMIKREADHVFSVNSLGLRKNRRKIFWPPRLLAGARPRSLYPAPLDIQALELVQGSPRLLGGELEFDSELGGRPGY